MWLEAWEYEMDFGSYRPQGFTEQEWKDLDVDEPDAKAGVPHGWAPQAWFEYNAWMRLGFPVRRRSRPSDDEVASAEADVDAEAAAAEAASDSSESEWF